MQHDENTQADRTPEVKPHVRPQAPWRVVSAQALSGHRLRVAFVDGTAGEVDMRAFLADSRLDDTPFAPLREVALFGQVRVVLGAVQWPTGADLAPDAMYDAIREHGCWTLTI